MRAVVQRVSSASVRVDEAVIGEIQSGFLVLLGIEQGDTQEDLEYLAEKTIRLRVFPDAEGKMNLDVTQAGGSVLVVSQFTLLGDCRKGRRPAFTAAAHPETANAMYEEFCALIRTKGVNVQTGQFAADMKVQLVNDGPVTLMLDSKKLF